MAAIVIIILVIAAAGVAGVLIIALIVQRKFKTSRKTIAISQDQTVPQSFGKINKDSVVWVYFYLMFIIDSYYEIT